MRVTIQTGKGRLPIFIAIPTALLTGPLSLPLRAPCSNGRRRMKAFPMRRCIRSPGEYAKARKRCAKQSFRSWKFMR